MATAMELLTITIFCKMQRVRNSTTPKTKQNKQLIALYKIFNIWIKPMISQTSGKSERRTKFVIANYIEWDVI